MCNVDKINNEEENKITYDNEHLQRGLAEIFVQNHVTRQVATSVLKLIKPHLPHYSLPLDSRTLLGTPRSVSDRSIGGGIYHHFGLERSLVEACRGKSFLDNEDLKLLSLQVNIDGLPVFKSTNSSFWPILCRVYSGIDIHTSPFPVGLFYGDSKPTDVDEYLDEFCKDYLSVKESGIRMNHRLYDVEISCFICDAPARAYIKRVKTFSGYHGCDRCTTRGDYLSTAVRFVERNAPIRTDESFLLQSDKPHHLGTSCLTNLGLGLVTGFPLDYMHLVLLGVMRKLIYAWTRSKNYKCLLGPRERGKISEHLIALQSYCPTEFGRKPRTIKELDRWKATEFRTFLLYTGIVVMDIVFRSAKFRPMYDHFLLLVCAMRILLNDETCVQDNALADALLKKFVKGCNEIYGQELMSYNVHGLVHLAKDALKFGNLETVSAFPFENFLQKLKRLVKGANGALVQVVKRLEEERSLTPFSIKTPETVLLRRTTGKPCPAELVSNPQFFGVVHKDLRYSTLKRDRCIMTSDGIALIVNVLQIGGEVKFVVKKFSSVEPLFLKPMDSTVLGIVKVNALNDTLHVVSLSDVRNKCFRMTVGTTTVAAGYTSLRKVCVNINISIIAIFTFKIYFELKVLRTNNLSS